MASELVRNVWCDVHDDERRPVSEAGEGVPLRVGNLAGTVDLCDECIAAHVTPFAEFVETYARPDDGAPVKADGAGRLLCPDCGKSYTYRNSLQTHMREAHRKVLDALPTGGGNRTCPHCRLVTGSAPGLAQHIKSAHPDKWTGKLATSLA